MASYSTGRSFDCYFLWGESTENVAIAPPHLYPVMRVHWGQFWGLRQQNHTKTGWELELLALEIHFVPERHQADLYQILGSLGPLSHITGFIVLSGLSNLPQRSSYFSLLHPLRLKFAWLLTLFSYLIFSNPRFHLIFKFTVCHLPDVC